MIYPHEINQGFIEIFKLLAALAAFAVCFTGILVALARANGRIDRRGKG